jgi:hypothetical protein
MKKFVILPMLALAAFAGAPQQSYALSCIDPEGMIEYIVSNPDYLVVTATPVEQAERVKNKAVKDDPNMMYDSGYTGQLLDIQEAHMGMVPDMQWVYFMRDGTWNYLCAGAPPKEGTKNIYVINAPTSVFELQTVVAVYPEDSELADDLLAAIEEADMESEPSIYEVPKADWVTRLHDELKDMAFIIKVKLAEWTSWKSMK